MALVLHAMYASCRRNGTFFMQKRFGFIVLLLELVPVIIWGLHENCKGIKKNQKAYSIRTFSPLKILESTPQIVCLAHFLGLGGRR